MPAPPEARQALSAARRIVLVRHGRTSWNAAGRLQGQLDPPLDDTGVAEAAAAAEVLATLPVAAVVASDLQRAAATAGPLARLLGRPATLDPRLREIGLGAWQGLTIDEARLTFPAEYDGWRHGVDVRRGGGETYAEVARRTLPAIEAALGDVPPGQVLVVVTHGGTARAAIGALLGLAPALWSRLGPLGNARWSLLIALDDVWRLIEHNAGVVPLGPHRLQISAPDVEPVKSASPEGV
ncbi:MAG: histidine phosphatase family protein [Mycobacteriales bacterium]